MKKTKITMLLFLFMITAKLNAQTCSDPVLLPDWGDVWTGVDSFSTSAKWLKFKADSSRLIIKARVFNYNSSSHDIVVYENNCSTLPIVTTTTSSSGDILIITTPALIVGNYYLIKLVNNSGSYMKYHLTKFYLPPPSTLLGCSTVTCSLTGNCELVCNGSFECYNLVPGGSQGVYDGFVQNWVSPTWATSDYFNAAATPTPGVSVPCNFWGYSNAYTGSAYAGIIVHRNTNTDFQEYLETKLSSSLQSGKVYEISFYAKRASGGGYQPVEEIGIFLTTAQITNTNPIGNTSVIQNYTAAASTTNTTLLNDFYNWQKISFTYTSLGGEQFLTIGKTTTVLPAPTVSAAPYSSICPYYTPQDIAYLFIDEVSCKEKTTPATFTLPSTMCQAQTLTLNPSVNPSGGTFSGTGVTGSSGNYYFNAAQNLSPGTYTIIYTYTAGTTCVQTLTVSALTTIQSTYAPTTTLSLPSIICQNETINLNSSLVPSYNGGTFSGTGVTLSAGVYYFNSAQNLAPGTYTVVYTYTLGTTCPQVYTTSAQIAIQNTMALTATASNYAICTNSAQTSSTLYVSSTYTGALTYTWLPSSANGSSLAVSPTLSTIYTVSAIYLGCTYSTAVAITVNSACCTSTVTALNIGTFTSSVTYSNSPYVFNNDIVIGPGVTTTFYDAEYLFATNVKITVKNGASLVFYGSHLYGCNDMWQGIVVEDGGMVQIAGGTGTHDALFEDAIVGIDITNHTTSTITPSTGQILTVDKAVFNKNYIAIRINNYKRDFQPYPFVIRNSVFTSRSLTFTPTSWPTCSTTTGSMREATSSTVGLMPPYALMGFTVTNLKSPYTLQSAHKGIELVSVGTTTYPTTYKSIQIGSQANISDYNIFDALGHGIESINSNMYSLNNVFQNSQRYVINPFVAPSFTFGGNGIQHLTNNDFNSSLIMTPSGATSPTLSNLGNRFYDCHYAINCDNAYNVSCRFATFRSTQTNTNTTFGTGNTGISLRSNRMFYIIDDNNFANINTAINVPIGVGTYSTNVSNYFGVNANCLQMNRNYIGAQITAATTPTNEYVNKAITISFPLTTSLTNVTTPNFVIQSNTISNVYRGIEVNAMSKINFPVQARTNSITLLDDNVFSGGQWGLNMLDNGAGTIRSNTIIGASTSNSNVALFYSSQSDKDSVFCNDLRTAYQGFVFEQPNLMNHWKGNKMSTLERGMTLVSNGIIGIQGGTGGAIDNEWNNSWTGSNYGTFVGASSTATLSRIYIKTSGNYYPPNPGWAASIPTVATYSNTANTPTTTGSFSCDDETPVANPSNLFFELGGLENANHAYIANSKMYRYYLMMDEVERVVYSTYFETYATEDMAHAFEVEKYLQAGDIENAERYNGFISVDNSAEYYVQTFNNIYINYLQEDYTDEDSTTLYYIANSCPGEYGSPVYQARALYNYIYSGAFNYIEDCSGGGAKSNPVEINAISSIRNKIELNVSVFPNPANDHLTIVGKGEGNDKLGLTISDLSGKVILKKQITTNEKFEVDLKNGMYFLTIVNSRNEKSVRKLIISK